MWTIDLSRLSSQEVEIIYRSILFGRNSKKFRANSVWFG